LFEVLHSSNLSFESRFLPQSSLIGVIASERHLPSNP
jgi:hypothetical protein